MNEKQAHQRMNESIKRLDEAYVVFKKNVREHLKSKSKSLAEMKEFMKEMDTESLEFICKDIALEVELYEVCQAVQEVINERKEGL